jgi:hypothetical protein
MTVNLTIPERMAVAGIFRTKKSDDVHELVEWSRRAQEIGTITEAEKKEINYRIVEGHPEYNDTVPPKTYITELSDNEVEHIMSVITMLAQKKKLTAGNEHILSLYEKLSAHQQG